MGSISPGSKQRKAKWGAEVGPFRNLDVREMAGRVRSSTQMFRRARSWFRSTRHVTYRLRFNNDGKIDVSGLLLILFERTNNSSNNNSSNNNSSNNNSYFDLTVKLEINRFSGRRLMTLCSTFKPVIGTKNCFADDATERMLSITTLFYLLIVRYLCSLLIVITNH